MYTILIIQNIVKYIKSEVAQPVEALRSVLLFIKASSIDIVHRTTIDTKYCNYCKIGIQLNGLINI